MNSAAKACDGKIRYLDKAAARQARKHMIGAGKVNGKLNAYVCDYCGFFHLGHMPQVVRNGQVDKDQWRRPA